MKTRNVMFLLGLIAFAAIGTSNQASGDPIAVSNSSFETVGVDKGAGYWYGFPDPSADSTWTSAKGYGGYQIQDISAKDNFDSTPDTGSKYLNLFETGTISQTLGSVLANEQITLSFWGGRSKNVNNTTGGTVTATISLDGVAFASETFDFTGGDVGAWYQKTLSGSTTAAGTLSISFTHGASGNAWIDAVSVSSIPEPGTFIITITGLIGLLAYAWRKRK